MKQRTLAILAIVTLFFVVAAVVVNSRSPAFTRANGGELVFPDLAQHLNDAAKIVVASAGGKFTIQRAGEGWGVAEKYGFPAKYDTVKGTLVALSQLRTIESKTAEPSLYSRIEVEDPTTKGAKSAEITVEDAKGAVLASLIVGKRRIARGGSDEAVELYVRKAGDAQSWLASGSLERNDDVKLWMAREIVNIDRNRVRQVTVAPAPQAPKAGADQPYTIVKDKPGENDFTLEGVPANDKVKSSFDISSVAGALALLNADDVLPAKDLKIDAPLQRSLEYRTFDGLSVDLKLYAQDGKTWIKIAAAYNAAAAAPPQAPTNAPGAAPADGQVKLKTAPDIQKEADAINARAKDWVYGLAASDLGTFQKKFADLIEPKDKPKPKS